MSLPEIRDILFTADGITDRPMCPTEWALSQNLAAPMCRELLSNDLSVNNLDEARFTDKVDPVDSLRRIGKAWHAIGLTCRCHSNQACDICEIYYLLEEAFEPPKSAE